MRALPSPRGLIASHTAFVFHDIDEDAMRRSLYIFLLLLPPQVLAAGTLRDAIERAWERQPAA